MTGHEHVVRPHAPAEEADRDAREHHDRVAEQRLAREHGQDLGDDAHARKDEDVHLGMAEDPEQVLVQQRIAAGAALKKLRVEVAVDERPWISAAVTGGIANSVRNAMTSIIHTNTGIRIIVMPGARMLRIGHDEVDRGRDRPDAEHDQADGPEVGDLGPAGSRWRAACS